LLKIILYKCLHKTLDIYETNDTYLITQESSIFDKNEQIGKSVKEVSERGICCKKLIRIIDRYSGLNHGYLTLLCY